MAAGRGADRERFVRDFLRYHGARLEGGARGAFIAELPAALARRLKVPVRLEVAFRAAELEEHPGAMLLVPGNPLFDRILRLARRGGGLSRRYLRSALRSSPGRDPAGLLPAEGLLATARLAAPAYRSRLLFTFRVAYRAFEGFDDIRSVVVGAPAGRAVDGGDFFRDQNLTDEPELGIEPAPPVDVDVALRTALAEIERQIAHRVSRFVQRAQGQLASETERLREFYLAVIAEEKGRRERRGEGRNDGRGEAGSDGRSEGGSDGPARSSGRGARSGGRGARNAGRGARNAGRSKDNGSQVIAATGRKLEWVERVDRETRLFAPRVTVTLLGLEEVWVPVCPMGLGPPEVRIEAELDLASGEVFGLACQACGAALSVADAEALCYAPPSQNSRSHDSPGRDDSPAGTACPSCARAPGRA
jgi:hypothetical protein